MYGTLSHLQPRQGQQQAVLDQLFRWEQERKNRCNTLAHHLQEIG